MPSVPAFRWSADILDELLVHLGLVLQFQHLQQCKAAPSRVSSELPRAVVADSADELRSDAGKPCYCEGDAPGMKAAMLTCFTWFASLVVWPALFLTVAHSCPQRSQLACSLKVAWLKCLCRCLPTAGSPMLK